MTNIKYLVRIINENGKKSEPIGTSSIKNMPPPTNVPSLKAILGYANYYNVFFFFSEHAFLRTSLNNLQKKIPIGIRQPNAKTTKKLKIF